MTGPQQLFEDALKNHPPTWSLSTLWLVLPFAWFQPDASTEMKRALALAHRWARAHQRGFARLNGYHCDL